MLPTLGNDLSERNDKGRRSVFAMSRIKFTQASVFTVGYFVRDGLGGFSNGR